MSTTLCFVFFPYSLAIEVNNGLLVYWLLLFVYVSHTSSTYCRFVFRVAKQNNKKQEVKIKMIVMIILIIQKTNISNKKTPQTATANLNKLNRIT